MENTNAVRMDLKVNGDVNIFGIVTPKEYGFCIYDNTESVVAFPFSSFEELSNGILNENMENTLFDNVGYAEIMHLTSHIIYDGGLYLNGGWLEATRINPKWVQTSQNKL